MNLLYSIDEKQDDTILQFINEKGISIDLRIQSFVEMDALINILGEGDCVIIDSINSIHKSILGLADFLQSIIEKNIRILSADGKLDLSFNDRSLLVIDSFRLAYEIDSSYRSVQTRKALQVKKNEGMVLGRRKGWRKNKNTMKTENLVDMS